MDEFKKEYSILFNGITDTINELECAIRRLKKLQQKAEEACLEGGDPPSAPAGGSPGK